jgi:hypothetical protein
VTRRVLGVATFCFALVIGVLVIMSSMRTNVEPDTAADAAAPTPRTTTARPAAPGAEKPAAASRSASRAPAREPAPEPEAAPAETVTELGTLRIETDVPGAQVFIDRQFIGTTPVTASNVKPGTHQLNLTAEGFDGIAQTIDVESGPRDLMFRFREVRLDAALAVVHQHRIGSCEGRLVATADGIRYETTNKDDGFNAPLADMETFEVDYQARNLRIKLRKGGQFNFTDPDDNADRLFVFHRDVERARQRLAP